MNQTTPLPLQKLMFSRKFSQTCISAGKDICIIVWFVLSLPQTDNEGIH
jgi:hypothetical protein